MTSLERLEILNQRLDNNKISYSEWELALNSIVEQSNREHEERMNTLQKEIFSLRRKLIIFKEESGLN